MDLQPIFQDLLMALIVALVGLVVYAVKRGVTVLEIYLDKKLGIANTEFIKSQAATVVRYLEQSPIFKDLEGGEKKERAILDIINFCHTHNLPIDRAFIDRAIEEAVHLMNENKIVDAVTIEGIKG